MCSLIQRGNLFTMCTYIKSSPCTLYISFNFICRLYLNKAGKKEPQFKEGRGAYFINPGRQMMRIRIRDFELG